jgi:hypothetical protein
VRLGAGQSERNPRVHKGTFLDLAGVDFMTDQSAQKLAALRSERRRIINCSPYIETLLQTVLPIENKS